MILKATASRDQSSSLLPTPQQPCSKMLTQSMCKAALAENKTALQREGYAQLYRICRLCKRMLAVLAEISGVAIVVPQQIETQQANLGCHPPEGGRSCSGVTTDVQMTNIIPHGEKGCFVMCSSGLITPLKPLPSPKPSPRLHIQFLQ